jgi:Ca2+-binding RTX toxin-like protein
MAIYDITLNFDKTVSAIYQTAFQAAATRWGNIITADLPDYNGIHDLVINVSMPAIDGVHGILGQAGATLFRPITNLPAMGIMQFDIADVIDMANKNLLPDVIFHEMAHVLGFGNLWQSDHLEANVQYTGVNALAAYRILSNNPTATGIPVETYGGSGTAGVHWDDQTFGSELMTGYTSSGVMPLSAMSIGAMADLGYTVDYSKADAYTMPTGLELANLQQLVVGHFIANNKATVNDDVLLGTSRNDKLSGLAGNDTLFGLVGNDTLFGLDGNDTLDGGTGWDVLKGGNDNDTYIVDNKNDGVVETNTEGNDTVKASISYTLPSNVENLTLTGATAINGIGNIENNVLIGNSSNNKLSGGSGDDTLSGGDGNDTLNGGLGNDTLTGGGDGLNVFLFNTKLSACNVDTITDFVVSNDKIYLENAIFSKLAKTGVLNPNFFNIETSATDCNDYLIYDETTGALFYDNDGSGTHTAMQIATLGLNLALTNNDFFVI